MWGSVHVTCGMQSVLCAGFGLYGCISPRLIAEEVERYTLEYQKRNASARDAQSYGHIPLYYNYDYNYKHSYNYT